MRRTMKDFMQSYHEFLTIQSEAMLQQVSRDIKNIKLMLKQTRLNEAQTIEVYEHLRFIKYKLIEIFTWEEDQKVLNTIREVDSIINLVLEPHAEM